MAIKPISVSQLNDYISRVLITDPILGNVTVRGEISGINYHSSGHVYFSIVDSSSKVSCFLPRNYAETLRFKLDDGMEITLVGSVNVFKKNGTYSIYVKSIEIAGAGNLAIAFEKLKKQLSEEGLFDISKKKKIPSFPNKIGVITSKTGAAIRDILKIIQTRNNYVDVYVFPVLVQGESAGKDIARMIDFVNNNYSDIDTLIVGRGGGSAEDLWAFNEEVVARSIFNSRIPIISGVGHEIDFTISDLVADVRAETPTAAAAIAVPDIKVLKENVNDLKSMLYVQLSNKFMFNRLKVDNFIKDIQVSLDGKILSAENQLEKLKVVLEENNPFKILSKGFAVIENFDKKIITDPADIKDGESYKITFDKGIENYKLIKIGCESDE